MKSLLVVAIVLSAATASAASIGVKESEIAGKTNLVTTADRTVNGKALKILVDSNGISAVYFRT